MFRLGVSQVGGATFHAVHSFDGGSLVLEGSANGGAGAVYEIGAFLGSGAESNVYEAVNRETDEVCAANQSRARVFASIVLVARKNPRLRGQSASYFRRARCSKVS